MKKAKTRSGKDKDQKPRRGEHHALFDRNKIAGNILQSLYLDSNTVLYKNQDNPTFAAYTTLQMVAAGKKYSRKDKSSESKRRRASFAKFIANMARMEEIDSNIDALLDQHRDVIVLARHIIARILGSCDTEYVFQAARHSAGTTIGKTYALCNLEDKWAFPLSTTPGVRRIFEEYLMWDWQLAGILYGFNRYSDQPMYREVTTNEITTVPKDDEIDRIIAKESTLAMFFQQGLMALMYYRLSEFGINLSETPDKHRLTVLLQSVSRKLATIDFSMASDSVLLSLVRALFPRDWYDWLTLVRAPAGQFPKTYGCLVTNYPIISSMGNATTFPVETIIFLAIALAVHQLGASDSKSRIPDWTLLDTTRNIISVFGDDVIIPVEDAPHFMSVCADFGLLINQKKSFYGEERFRESCGVDAFDARNVRPFYLKAPSVETNVGYEAWLYTCFNKLKPIAISAYGPLAWHYMSTPQYLLKALHDLTNGDILVVPDHMPDDSGLKLFNEPVTRDLMRAQGFKMAPIFTDQHGTVKFKYLRALYSQFGPPSEPLHFARKLKNLDTDTSDLGRFLSFSQVLANDAVVNRYTSRKALKYVVRRTDTCFAVWDKTPT